MRTKRLAALIREIYRKYPTGGALHIVLDDYNTASEYIFWCIEHIEKYAEKEDFQTFIDCAGLLLSIPERRRLRAIRKAKQWAITI